MKVERVEEIYKALEGFEIELDPDPQIRGPKYLQGVIATCRNYLNAVSQILLEVHREKQMLARDLRARETAFQLSFDNHLANDERVRRLPNIEDRKAAIRIFLREDAHGIDRVKAETEDLDFVEKAIRHRHRELTATMSEIKLQKGLIQTEIGTGAFYGDERIEVGVPGKGPLGMSVADASDVSDADLADLFDQAVMGPTLRPSGAGPRPGCPASGAFQAGVGSDPTPGPADSSGGPTPDRGRRAQVPRRA